MKNKLNSEYLDKYGKDQSSWQYNCYCATMMYHNFIDWLDRKWVTVDAITEWVNSYTEITTRLQKNAIIVLYGVCCSTGNDDSIIHTAVYLGNGMIYHKRGSNVAEIISLKEMLTIYHDYDRIEKRIVI